MNAPDPFPPKLLLPLRFPVLIALLVFLAHTNTLNSPFHFDDLEAILRDAPDTAFFLQTSHLRYRHLFYLSFNLNHLLGGTHPLGFHLVNILLHFATAILFFAICRILLDKVARWEPGKSAQTAALAAILFTLHPVQAETVTYLSGRSLGMATFFFCIAFLLFLLGNLKNRSLPMRAVCFLSSFAAMALAALSKETAIVFIPFILFFDLLLMRGDVWLSAKHRLYLFYLPAIAGVIPFLLSSKILSRIVELWLSKADPIYAAAQLQVLVHPLRLFFFPFNLNLDYDFPLTLNIFTVEFACAVAVHAALIYWAVKQFYQKSELLTFCLFWFYIAMAPTNSFLPRADLFSERNTYLAFMGLSLFAAVAVRIWIFDKIKSSVRLYPIALCALCLVLTFHTALLIKRNAAYRTESALLEDTLKKSPHKLRVMQNLVRALMLEGNPNRALAILQTMRAQNPNYYFTRVNLGTIYARFGDLASAEEEFKAALAIDSSAAEAHFNLGSIYALQGRLEEALTAYTSGESWYRARALQPPADALLNQIKLTLQLNLPERSEGVVKSFLAAYGDRTEIHLLLGQVYFKTGRLALAREEFLKADADPALSAQAANFLALIFIQENNLVAARAAFEKAVRLAPDRVEARVNLGKFLLESATDTAEGRRHLEYALRLTDDPRRREQILALLNQTPP